MQRDMDLVRKIILSIEAHSSGWAPELNIEDFDPKVVGYHCYLIVDSGLAKGTDITTRSSNGPEYVINHLTSAGHEFAESVRNEFIWDEVRQDMKSKGIASTTLDILKRLLDKKIRKQLQDE